MRLLVSPCSYKGTLSACELATAIADVAQGLGHETLFAPFADGGDDTLACLHSALGGEFVYLDVTGPTGRPVNARYLRLNKTAVVELASASGIAHLAIGELDALNAQTTGFGQVIARAIGDGAKNIYLTVGGSASTDGGAGALVALGARLLDDHGVDIAAGGIGLSSLSTIDLSCLRQTTAGCSFVVVSDVNSPLLGPSGAAYIFAPQKGADAAQVKLLEQALTHYASIFKQTIACDKSQLPGAGSAGGTGYGLAMALDAPVVSGFDWLSQMLNLEQKLEQCDAIVVAEGRIDSQSFDSGKAVGRLVSRAQALHKKVYALPAITSDEDFDNGNITRLIQSSHYADSGQADIAAVKLATKALLS